MPIDYSKGKIYKIVCNVTGLIYVGSTCEPNLARRLTGHVADYKRWENGKRNYVTSFKCLENDDYDILLIENYPCNSKDELYARERNLTNQVECVNKVKNQGLKIELGNKEYNKQKNQKYYEENKEIISEKKKQHYEINKEAIKISHKQYREDNKESILLKKCEKHICECGGCYTSTNKARHMTSKKHQKYLITI